MRRIKPVEPEYLQCRRCKHFVQLGDWQTHPYICKLPIKPKPPKNKEELVHAA
jgi:hypothetical protein